MHITPDHIQNAAKDYATQVDDYILNHDYIATIEPEVVREGTVQYIKHGGKRMRPFVARTACEALGGNPDHVLPAAAAVEVFHMWTLVHDDIIDRDELRRGQRTLHLHYAHDAIENNTIHSDNAHHYGLSLSLLTGDVQQGLAVNLLSDLSEHMDAAVVLALVQEMMGPLLVSVMKGEVMDVQFAFMFRKPSLDQLLDMISGKTSALLDFSVLVGATIALGTYAPDKPPTKDLREFAYNCGIAFQLQDDLLSLVGTEQSTGKPLGSDLREGKYTPTIHFALEKATGTRRVRILDVLGQPDVSEQDVLEIRSILEEVGAIRLTKDLAEERMLAGMQALHRLPRSAARDTLEAWAHYIIHRES